MYVTRPLPVYRKFPEAAHMAPPEGPNSGNLVVFDEESEAEATCCWGTCPDSRIRDLPFPQNKILTVRYTERHGESSTTYSDKVLFIPVMGQPASSNRYYVIRAQGKYAGQACTCSTEEDMSTCCFCNCIRDVKPMPLDHTNIYQQFEIVRRRSGNFVAKSIAPDGFPPHFLRRRGWRLYISNSTPPNCILSGAHEVNLSLRMRLPDFSFPISDKYSPATIIGKWYSPFMFINEQISLKEQMKNSMFYEITLQQMWEEIYMCENDGHKGNVVIIDLNLKREVVLFSGEEEVEEEREIVDGMRWFKSVNRGSRMGLSLAIIQRMRWEEVRGAWIEGIDREMRMQKVEEFGGGESGWKRFGYYVLVERFVLRRMDSSIVITFDFRHTDRIQCKWE